MASSRYIEQREYLPAIERQCGGCQTAEFELEIAMLLNRVATRARSILIVCLIYIITSSVTAAPIAGTAQLGGWAYIDRNNDGQLAFVGDPNPEFVIDGVWISLYSKLNNIETLVTSVQTDNVGRYLFENILPGTYGLRETQPVKFVDGLDTLGILQSWSGQPIPSSASAGVAFDNGFSDIVLPADVGGEFYNFGERGLAAGFVSKRDSFASAPPPPATEPPPPGGGPPTPEPSALMLVIAAAFACGVPRTARPR